MNSDTLFLLITLGVPIAYSIYVSLRYERYKNLSIKLIGDLTDAVCKHEETIENMRRLP